MAKALLVMDMLNDFLKEGAPLVVPMGRKIVSKIKEHIEIHGKRKDSVFFLNDNHDMDDKEFKDWPKHAIKDTDGANLYGELMNEYVRIGRYAYDPKIIHKRTYSGFLQTDLWELTRQRVINEIYITGILTNICVFITAVEAKMRGYETFVYRDGVTALSQEANHRALEQLEKVFKIKVL